VKSVLTAALFGLSGSTKEGINPILDDQIFQTISVQLKALGLVNIEYVKTTKGGMGLFWTLTPKGERLMNEIRTVRSEPKVK